MKKLIIVLAIIIGILSLNKNEQIVIPKESIRFRVIAASNKEEDQKLKQEIVANLSEALALNNITSIQKSREYLENNLPKFTEIVEKTIKDATTNRTFHINYGKNYFPRKEYQNIVYEAGEYESLVITLGEGEGKNFWCVLFPPLCFINENENVEYKSIVKEIINRYF